VGVGLVAVFPLLGQGPIRGFSTDQWKAQHEREEQAQAIPSTERLRIYMEHMAAKPHPAGSAGAKAVADYAVGLMKDWGLDARVEMFEALLPYPTYRALEMTAPVRFRAQLSEPPVPGDDDSGDAGQFPPFNAYSASVT